MFLFKNNKSRYLNEDLDNRDGRHLIDLMDVVKIYQNAAGTFVALDHVDLQVDEGEFVAIIGKSGSGKSTLINMITVIDRPSNGQIFVNHIPVHQLNEEQTALWRGHSIGVIFQFFQLLPTLTAVENVMLPMDFAQNRWRPTHERPVRAMHLLEQVGMADYAHKMPSELSGGQQQCVAIARASANNPPILTADEPTGNLDSKSAETVMNLFENLVSLGKSILMVTHDNDLAERVSRKVIIADGKIIDEVRK
jgi:putative ABC transport system ATP-binding protein